MRFYKRNSKIILHPENDTMSDMIYDNVVILGIVEGLIRKFIEDEQYDEIIRYLVDVAEELCICKLTDHHKRKLLMTTTASREEKVIRLRQEMINIFTNYMTLTELKSGVVRTKVLNRFIIR